MPLHRAVALACAASTVIAAESPASAHPIDGDPVAPREAELPTYLRAEVDGFVVLYHPSLGDRVRNEVDSLPAVRRQLEAQLGTPVLGHVDLEVTLGSHEALEGAPRTRVILSSGWAHDAAAVRESIRFELARKAIREASAEAVPSWFERAFAERFSRGATPSNTLAMVHLTLFDKVPPLVALADLDRERCHLGCESETAAAHDFVRFVSSREDALAHVMTSLREGEATDFEDAISDATRIPIDALDRAWHHESSGRHWLIAAISAFTLGLVGWAFVRILQRVLRRKPAARQVLPAWRRRRARAVGRPSNGLEESVMIAGRAEIPRIEHDGSWHTLH